MPEFGTSNVQAHNGRYFGDHGPKSQEALPDTFLELVAKRLIGFAARPSPLGTLPLDPSQAVRQGREIEARSASSCCERPVRLRAARNMLPVISTIVMFRLFAWRHRTSMSAYFTNSLTPPTGLGLLASPSRRVSFRSGSAWLGRSQKDGLPPRCGRDCRHSGSRPSTRAQGRGSLVAAPFKSGAGMDAKSRDLALLAFLSLFCAICLGGGSRRFWLGVFCARCSRDCRRSL